MRAVQVTAWLPNKQYQLPSGGDDYVSLGRDVESQVLARAIHAHIHHRTFINGNRTIVLPASPGTLCLGADGLNMARVINGKEAARAVIEAVTAAAGQLEQATGTRPGLAVIIVGDIPASHAYFAAKSRMARDCGFNSVRHTYAAGADPAGRIGRADCSLNADVAIHGILVKLPLPDPLDAQDLLQSIRPEKDVDGLHVVNAGKLATGLISCTPAGAMLLIRYIHGLSGLDAVVIGRSNLFGKPMAQLLLHANAKVTAAHSRTKDMPSVARRADLLVAAVGRPEMVRASWIKPGATVIDVGINRIAAPERCTGKSRLVRDVAYAEASQVAGAITPVPGGIDPMMIAMLMANTVIAAHRALGLTPLPLAS